MLAVVALVAFTFLAQHSSLGYVFGVLAMLTAAGLLAAYIRALPTPPQTADKTTQVIEPKQQSEIAAQSEVLLRNVYEAFWRKRALTERERVAQLHEALYLDGLQRERQFRLSVNAVEYRTADLKAGGYYTQVKYHRDPVDDAASIITNIVEKLCASSKEPRFEFILGPDGSFKIQQVASKRSAIEPITAQEESVEPFKKADEPQVVN
jgi:hypothetical protein